MVSFSKLNQFIRQSYTKNLFVSNTLSCMVLLAVGDGFTQYVGAKAASQQPFLADFIVPKSASNLTATKSSPMFNFDWSRNNNMIALGVFLGPLTHFWYKFLDNRFPRRTKFLIVKKLLIDQLFMSPIMNITLIVGLHLLEGMAFRDLGKQFDEKFVTLYKYDCALWIPAQAFNFQYIPSRYRVLYVNMVTLFWNTISSYIMFNSEENCDLNCTFN